MLPASALLKRRPRLHLIKLVSAVAALSLVALLYGQHVLRSGAAHNAVAEGGERKMDIVISQESAAASNAGEREDQGRLTSILAHSITRASYLTEGIVLKQGDSLLKEICQHGNCRQSVISRSNPFGPPLR